jgi:hypothetical protein
MRSEDEQESAEGSISSEINSRSSDRSVLTAVITQETSKVETVVRAGSSVLVRVQGRARRTSSEHPDQWERRYPPP